MKMIDCIGLNDHMRMIDYIGLNDHVKMIDCTHGTQARAVDVRKT